MAAVREKSRATVAVSQRLRPDAAAADPGTWDDRRGSAADLGDLGWAPDPVRRLAARLGSLHRRAGNGVQRRRHRRITRLRAARTGAARRGGARPVGHLAALA